jgi:hypothetical protein
LLRKVVVHLRHEDVFSLTFLFPEL